MRAKAWIVLLLICCLTSVAWAQADAGLEARAEKLEARLMAPCCMSGPVADHNSAISFQIRDEIRAMLARGQSDREILDRYVAQYGTQILAIPDPVGFNLTAYLAPLVVLLLVMGSVVVLLLRWQRATLPLAAAAPPSAPADPVLLERLEAELREMD